jgi:CRISPR-associated protein Cas5t
MNIAAIEIRDYSDSITTKIRSDIPTVQIAIGLVTPVSEETGERSFPEGATIYQQLHSYPVGNSGEKTLKPKTKGAKYWIVPIRRELLVGFDCVIGIRTEDASLIKQIEDGLSGTLQKPRYGLPFLGDNNYLIDRIDWISEAPEVTSWYVPMEMSDGPQKGSCRLTIGIDRTDNSKTTSMLFAPSATMTSIAPEVAWTWTPHIHALETNSQAT